ncbi:MULTISPECIES: iron-siderophore ABC transporter substrate-binding protein [unclassified Enterococcus]|uniref:ABC transporter substrate-binding protein n=1 Tax=unclassified Enterococcus TaxID=2608891 RepID=UPI00155382A1|nr:MULTISPECIES: iron-siderophore ABC transporter substrate-binding protein [unclassified Enterococcus]MBS7576758.1 iron-siderophore ABC transporter substrate-binding protein [Enterococcus sp. MMGLQ5-2]MBS7583755.1 iron-siderophore ABC transporter substrate-binding protein [Enterococcus sp. MMGLQ5-1]NPD11616.1 iron-siderophore ABC transporter substrate-binding protein [Enterococcus sp. MMGLQ5-1]NPD36595.1 iron-siderophore ABC transporter substrate-binding protein [Enterococcus sp. MMGLQ5-2]
MKKKLFVVSTMVLSLFIAGCSQNDSASKTDTSTSESSAVAKEGTVKYLGTEYTVKYPTDKIVTASFEAMEDAAALDVQPIGAVTISGEMPSYLKDKLGDKVTNVGDKFGPDVESVTALSPDVILGSTKFDDEVTNNLNKIAPTINVSHKSADWADNLKLLGTLSGKSAEAEKLVSDYNDDLSTFKEANSSISDQKILMIRIREGELCIYGPDFYYNPMLYNDLGFAIPTEVSSITSQTTISTEQVAKIDADIILVQFIDSENEGFTTALDDLKANPIWKSVPAVANNKVYYNIVDGGYQGGTYLSKEVMLKAIKDDVID